MELYRYESRARSHDLDRMVDNAKRASDFLKALAHESRLMILCILAEGEKSVSELELQLNLRQPTVSQQPKITSSTAAGSTPVRKTKKVALRGYWRLGQ